MLPVLLDTRTAAFILGVARKTVQVWIHTGRLEGLHLGRSSHAKLRVTEDAIRRFLGLPPETPLPYASILHEETVFAGSRGVGTAEKSVRDALSQLGQITGKGRRKRSKSEKAGGTR